MILGVVGEGFRGWGVFSCVYVCIRSWVGVVGLVLCWLYVDKKKNESEDFSSEVFRIVIAVVVGIVAIVMPASMAMVGFFWTRIPY